MIEQLSGRQELRQTKALYEEVFPEDSKEFVDYYYHDKVVDSLAYVKKVNGTIEAMIHMNPFWCYWNTDIVTREKIYYLVAVATRTEARHRGYMNGLLHRVVRESYEQQIPFLALMPANPQIYEPYDFTYITRRASYSPCDHIICQENCIRSNELHELVVLSNSILSERYTCYVERDVAYYERLLLELESQQGSLYWLVKEGERIGYCFYESAEGSVQEFGLLPEFSMEETVLEEFIIEEQVGKPHMMGRIIALDKMGDWCCLREEVIEESIAVVLFIQDGMIKENHGLFRWVIHREGSRFEPLQEVDQDQMIWTITIAQLTSILFGYETINQCCIGVLEEYKLLQRKIKIKMDIFFQEVV
ncbi:MAG: GNAT family N-acetyltransferase [Eubacteriales bacterium]